MNGRYLGIGGHAFQDKAGKSAFGTLNAGLSVAYDLRLSRFGEFALGLQGSYGQRSATLEGLSWDSQYTGTNFDPALPAGEAVFNQSVSYMDLAAGVLWRHILFGHETSLGAAVHHPHQPRVPLLGGGDDPLLMRITAHGEARIEGESWIAIPRFLVSKQGGAVEAVIGGMMEHPFGTSSRFTDARTASAILFGCLYRWNDAVIPAMQLDYHRFLSIGFSYDVNISRLRDRTNFQGGMEVALVYHGAFSDDRRKLKGRAPTQQ
jgi:type IX secretion system PorP/SprF family membrane protein